MSEKWREVPIATLLPRSEINQGWKGVTDSDFCHQFINTGFQCITEFLSESEEPTTECIRRMGDLLRVLIHVSQPCRDVLSTLPAVDSQIQETFGGALENIFKTYEPPMLSNENQLQERSNLVLLMRLLQFVLSFRSTWTTKSKEIYVTLSKIIFRLSLVSTHVRHLELLKADQIFKYCANEDSLDIDIYPILFDTLLVLYDGDFCASPAVDGIHS